MSTFNSWNTINESLFKRRKRQVVTGADGKKQIVTYKVQKDGKFMMKFIKFPSLIDAAGKITSLGSAEIIKYINQNADLVAITGGSVLDSNWFNERALAYVVKKDTQFEDDGKKRGREKVQFQTITKSDYPDIEFPEGTMFLPAEALQNPDLQSSLEDLATIDDTAEDPVDETDENQTEDEADQGDEDGDDSTGVDYAGKKFRYYMRTNKKTYLMEFTINGNIDADVVGGDKPNGLITYSDPNVEWTTNEDAGRDEMESWGGSPLFADTTITNGPDKSFLTKMFTDANFRNDVLNEYEEEWGGSEINSETLRSKLYYQNGTKIFPSASDSTSSGEESDQSSGDSASTNTATPYSGFVI